MSEYDKMREDGYNQSYRDKDIYQKDDKELLVHPTDPNWVKRLGGNEGWERYDKDKHDK